MTFTLLSVLLCVLIALIVRLSRLAKARNRIISQRARADRRKPRA